MLYESAQYEPTFLWGKIECCLYRRKILQAIKKKMLQNRTNREENKAVCIKPLHSLEDKKELPISRKIYYRLNLK